MPVTRADHDTAPHAAPAAHALDELDRQRAVLLELGIPAMAGLTDEQFAAAVEALRPRLGSTFGAAATTSRVPFVLVVDGDMSMAEQAVPLMTLTGRKEPGVLDRNHGAERLQPYVPIEQVDVPGQVYLLLDVERGEEFCGVRPADALPVILGRGRTPLTIHEGISLVLLHPEVLEPNRCFMLSGSRRGDRRVPAMWISGKAPKLGWCWDGNPHSWLGVASTGGRLSSDSAGGHLAGP